jgi:glycine dehydrogenase subunit 1
MRYLPLTQADRAQMLGVIGVSSVDDLFADVPAAARKAELFDLPRHAGEMEVERHLNSLAAKNRPAGAGPFFCGAGAYKHHIPSTVDHIITSSSARNS